MQDNGWDGGLTVFQVPASGLSGRMKQAMHDQADRCLDLEDQESNLAKLA